MSRAHLNYTIVAGLAAMTRAGGTVARQTKADFEGPDREQHEAVNGHVYLEKVEDTNGNRFFVLFKVLVVDEQSRYIAFVWRRLPGGKIVRRN